LHAHVFREAVAYERAVPEMERRSNQRRG
jgi:hypothetical protein